MACGSRIPHKWQGYRLPNEAQSTQVSKDTYQAGHCGGIEITPHKAGARPESPRTRLSRYCSFFPSARCRGRMRWPPGSSLVRGSESRSSCWVWVYQHRRVESKLPADQQNAMCSCVSFLFRHIPCHCGLVCDWFSPTGHGWQTR